MFPKDKKVFLEYFPYLMNVHFTKDVGQIPYAFRSVYKDYCSYILTVSNEDCVEFKKNSPDIKLIFLERIKVLKWNLSPYGFFVKNSRHIDVLYLYHFTYSFYETLRIGLLYKLLNPKGKLFVRFEADLNHINENYPFDLPVKNLKQKIKRNLYQIFYKKYFTKIDFFGIADFNDFRGVKKVKKLNNLVMNNSRQQLNGFNADYINMSTIIQNQKKKRIVLTGRHENPVKGFDVFLKAINYVDLEEWQIYVVGSSEKDILKVFSNEFDRLNEKIKEKIHFLGFLKSNSELIDLLKTTKIFVLPSRIDGMPIGAVEAMATGNAVVSSNHYGMQVALEDGSIGLLFENGNEKDLAVKLSLLLDNNQLIEELSQKAFEKAKREFQWEQIIKNVFGNID